MEVYCFFVFVCFDCVLGVRRNFYLRAPTGSEQQEECLMQNTVPRI